MLKKLKKIISCIFVFLGYRICLSVLKLRGKLKRKRVRSYPTTTRSIDLFIGYIVFAGQGQLDADKNYWSKCQINGSKYIQEI